MTKRTASWQQNFTLYPRLTVRSCLSRCYGEFSPELNRPIFAATGQGIPIRTIGKAPDLAPMTAEGIDCLSVVEIPKFDGGIAATTGQESPIRAEANGIDGVGMASQGGEQAPCIEVPEFDRPIGAAAGEHAAIRANGNGKDFVGVAAEEVIGFAGA